MTGALSSTTQRDDRPATRPHGYVLMSRRIDEATWAHDVRAGTRPRHYVFDLAERLGLAVRSPIGTQTTTSNRLFGAVFATPDAWAIARRVHRERAPGDVVYATDEGLAVAYLLSGFLRLFVTPHRRRERSHSCAVYLMAPHRTRVRCALFLLRLLRLTPGIVVVGFPELVEPAARRTARSTDDVVLLPITVDDRFFSPAHQPLPRRTRPLIASAGLEHRDYELLGDAVRGLDVDVVVCAVSPDDTGANTKVPREPLDNLHFEDLSIVGLRDLYQRADLFVLCTLPNRFGAGSTAVVEALSCGCPVLACIAEPDIGGLVSEGGVRRVAREPHALRAAINATLAAASGRANCERRTAAHRMTADAYVDRLAAVLESRMPTGSPS